MIYLVYPPSLKGGEKMSSAYIKCNQTDCDTTCQKKLKKDIRLACGSSGREYDVINRQGETLDLASVSIDLNGLISPLVKVDFSTTVEFEVETQSPGSSTTLDLELEFILSRVCEDGIEQELETYTFVRDFNITEGGSTLLVRTTDPISFTFCDCVNACKTGCCSYLIKVFVSSVDTTPVQTAKIDESFINAIAQGVVKCC
jgi:hypothetical protein